MPNHKLSENVFLEKIHLAMRWLVMSQADITVLKIYHFIYIYISKFDGEKRMIDCDEPSKATPAFQIDLFAY